MNAYLQDTKQMPIIEILYDKVEKIVAKNLFYDSGLTILQKSINFKALKGHRT